MFKVAGLNLTKGTIKTDIPINLSAILPSNLFKLLYLNLFMIITVV
jgi:hypothetical protein